MAKRFFRHLSLFYNGDWHTDLLKSLELAKDATCSNEIKAAIEALENLLSTSDECVHTVTVSHQVPGGLDAFMVMSHVQEQIQGEHASAAFKEPTTIELTLTGRGSRSHVLFVANSHASSAISAAKAEVWVRLQFGSSKRDAC